MILLDTNVVSELMKEAADPAVEHWFLLNEEETALPVIALAELSYGIARLADGARRQGLEARLTEWRVRYAGERRDAEDLLHLLDRQREHLAVDAAGDPGLPLVAALLLHLPPLLQAVGEEQDAVVRRRQHLAVRRARLDVASAR